MYTKPIGSARFTSQTNHCEDIQVCSEVTRNTVHHNLSWELQAAKNHRVPRWNTARCNNVDSRPQHHDKV